MQAATIKLFLVHGSPNGLRTAELSNWSGKAIAAPRTELAELSKRDELSGAGFYVLTGVDTETGDRAVYIGESENVSKRLKDHISKEFWTSATVFVSKDDNLTKAHIRYLEGALISLVVENDSIVVDNNASSGAKLPESDEAEMDVFLEKCLQLMPVLGVSEFQRVKQSETDDEELLYCNIKGLVAKGMRTENGFVVYAGSQAVLKHRESAKSIKTKRDSFIDKGYLKQIEDYLVFTKDFEFGSPSTAGSVVRGGNTNGLIYWKNKKGQSLKEIEATED